MARRRQATGVIDRRDSADFERLYDEHARGVFGVACRGLGDATQAQDVVQEVFLGLWRDPDRFDAGRGPLGHYLRMVARSKALDVRRGEQVANRARTRLRGSVRSDGDPPEARP